MAEHARPVAVFLSCTTQSTALVKLLKLLEVDKGEVEADLRGLHAEWNLKSLKALQRYAD